MLMSKPLVFDTNVYVSAVRGGLESAASIALQESLPRTYLASVVAAELRAGATTDSARRVVERFSLWARRVDRVVTPSAKSWDRAGDILAQGRLGQPELRSKVGRLWNDVLIALSARQIGARVVTCNVRDFEVIRRHFRFDMRDI